ncbi:MAG TPA: endolytic transglycosylase MltG [Gammaproteobacteria bacterium]
MFRRALFPLALIVFGSLAVVGVDAYRHLYRPLPMASATQYRLLPGTALRTVASQLQAEGILVRPLYFVLYARLKGVGGRLQAGEYRLETGISAVELLDKLERGEVVLHSLTIVEGWNFKQLRTALQSHNALVQKLSSGLNDSDVMSALGHPGQHPEGRFYPDTYSFPRGTSDVDFLKRAYGAMERRLEQEWRQRAPGLPLNSSYEALILASIIEKETAVPEERQLIAAVFVNRLKKRMRLQTDPTVIYGLGDRYDGDIKFRDLREDTPYNTYTRRGLPPTPIAMPGGASIHAALHPADSDALYFVSKGDGSHQFSVTLEQHEAAVDAYQRR